MRDIAAAAGVSPMTVSRALRKDSSVQPSTRDHILRVAEELGYIYDSTAIAFRAGKSGFVAVTLPSINNANFAATFRSLRHVLEETGLQILLGITDYDLGQEEKLIRQLLSRRPEALIVTGGSHTEAVRALLQSQSIPIIEIWDKPHAPLGHHIGFSNADAMEAVVTHLAEKGCRKLAFLGAHDDSDMRGAERRKGVFKFARQLGLPDVEHIGAGSAPVTMSAGATAVLSLGQRINEFDALVCVSDPVAFGALNACKMLGLNVPRQIAITGFGAFEIALVNQPKITTVSVSAEEIGTRAGTLVTRLLEETGNRDIERAHDIEPQLIVGETS